MSGDFITLRMFNASELIFDNAETRDILKFFFPHLKQGIDNAEITLGIRNFAQGLLVEAIDATYALGYVEILLTTFYSPRGEITKILLKAGRKAAVHWFKHATARDLHHAKSSEIVRRQLSNSFATPMRELLDPNVSKASSARGFAAYVWYFGSFAADGMWG